MTIIVSVGKFVWAVKNTAIINKIARLSKDKSNNSIIPVKKPINETDKVVNIIYEDVNFVAVVEGCRDEALTASLDLSGYCDREC